MILALIFNQNYTYCLDLSSTEFHRVVDVEDLFSHELSWYDFTAT